MKYGNDLSKHQSIDAVAQLKNGGKAEFVILRSSFGTYSEDANFAHYVKDSERFGLKNSVYHASYAGTVSEAVEEADFCIDTMEKYGLTREKVEMPIFYDYEYFSADYNAGRGIETTPQLVRALTLAFCGRVRERGYSAGVYLNKDYWDRFYGQKFFDDNPQLFIWYARPGLNKPDRDCYIWQYASDSGADFGYCGAIDKNILYGSFAEEEIKPMQPLSESPARLIIGFATAGDIAKLTVLINGLGIKTEVKDGYIITKVPVSKGDQCYIMAEVNNLGNIDCKIYEESKEESCADCESLKTENIKLQKQLKEKTKQNEECRQDIQRLTEENEQLKDKLLNQDSDKALTEQKRLNSELIKELKSLKEKVYAIKDIVG